MVEIAEAVEFKFATQRKHIGTRSRPATAAIRDLWQREAAGRTIRPWHTSTEPEDDTIGHDRQASRNQNLSLSSLNGTNGSPSSIC
jgi:hypothetical protein